MTAAASMLRCAIYTRKSSEEGLDQAFNSLHAQREACAAYIRSQAGEGWRIVGGAYDDGGHSGGSMDRPALERLMQDVAGGRIDVVVVYKVDRLTRSLIDFARIMEAFEAAGASFVSVTQAFNTTSSMGRLTLNMLLSFAQFEREVTGERIRDKIAASKAKGMWMGGVLPLGYDKPIDSRRALFVNSSEAETVRLIFSRFLALGSTGPLQCWLAQEGIRSKPRLSRSGRESGARPFSRGALRHLLGNRIYLGEIAHNGLVHRGRHAAIVDEATFAAAQALLEKISKDRRKRVSRADRCLLTGLLYDGDGQPMRPVFNKARRRAYQYYASAPLLPGAGGGQEDAIRRVPAAAVEDLVVRLVERFVGELDQPAVRDTIRNLIGRVEVQSAAVQLVIRSRLLPTRPDDRSSIDLIRSHLAPGEQVLVDPTKVGLLRVRLPIRLVVRGGRSWARDINGHPIALPTKPNLRLVRRLRAAHATLRAMDLEPDGADYRRLLDAQPSKLRTRTIIPAFLAPDIQRAILTGVQQPTAVLSRMIDRRLPLSWVVQRSRLANHEGRA